MTDEYKQAFLEQVCSTTSTNVTEQNPKDLQQFLKRLDSLKEKANLQGLKEENLFEILSYSPDDDLEDAEEENI